MDTELLARLEALKNRNIDARDRLLKQGRLYGTYDTEMQAVHRDNAHTLGDIVAEYGWPGISKVGLEGSRAAWFVAQHSICTPDLQRLFLRLLKEAVDAGDAPAKQVALLTDRVLFNEGKPQVYGTVLDWDETGELSCELEDPERVDELRAAVGLPAFDESLHKHRRAVQAEGGLPPEDLSAYQEAGSEWARSVGWR